VGRKIRALNMENEKQKLWEKSLRPDKSKFPRKWFFFVDLGKVIDLMEDQNRMVNSLRPLHGGSPAYGYEKRTYSRWEKKSTK
jgi:hypothetical protein